MKIDWAQNNRFLAGVDGTETHHFECNIEALTKEYGLPLFPGFAHADGAMTWEKPDGMAITFYLYDYCTMLLVVSLETGVSYSAGSSACASSLFLITPTALREIGIKWALLVLLLRRGS